jgi:hypothetical protein
MRLPAFGVLIQALSTTLLDPLVNLPQFFEAFEIVRLLRQQQCRENSLHDGANA